MEDTLALASAYTADVLATDLGLEGVFNTEGAEEVELGLLLVLPSLPRGRASSSGVMLWGAMSMAWPTRRLRSLNYTSLLSGRSCLDPAWWAS